MFWVHWPNLVDTGEGPVASETIGETDDGKLFDSQNIGDRSRIQASTTGRA